jgi:magnesium-dependent phosphatase 1
MKNADSSNFPLIKTIPLNHPPKISTSITTMSERSAEPSLPKLVAFDLDGTIWTPEMYELWGGGGSPFRVDPAAPHTLRDRAHTQVTLLGESARILHALKTHPRWSNTVVAWVSCCDEPEWAYECLSKFNTDPSSIPNHPMPLQASSDQPLRLEQCVDSKACMIFKSNKQTHFKRLRAAYPHIAYEEMVFFDNDMGNIRDVSPLGVKCVYTPHGMTHSVWEDGMRLFNAQPW